MKHSAQIVTFLSAKTGPWCHQSPLKLDIDPIFLSRELLPRYNHKLNTDETILFWRNRSSTTRSHTCQHHAEITQSHTFAALIRLSTTTHNLLTFNISEISSNNSEKLSLLPEKHLWTFLLHSSYSSSRMYSRTVGGSPQPCFLTRPGSKFTCNFALT